MARNLRRSSSGLRSSNASWSTRALNASQLSSRLRKFVGAGYAAVVTTGPSLTRASGISSLSSQRCRVRRVDGPRQQLVSPPSSRRTRGNRDSTRGSGRPDGLARAARLSPTFNVSDRSHRGKQAHVLGRRLRTERVNRYTVAPWALQDPESEPFQRNPAPPH